jgi:hypothetical protein
VVSLEEGSRRALIARGALAAGSLLGVSACAGAIPTTPTVRSGPPEPGQARLLNGLRALEMEAIHVFEAGIPVLGRSSIAGYAQQFLSYAIIRAAALAALVKEHGGAPTNLAARTYHGAPSTRLGTLELFRSLQRREIDAYLTAIPRITPGTARASLGAMLAAVAQQQALVRRALGEPALQGPIVSRSS